MKEDKERTHISQKQNKEGQETGKDKNFKN